MKTNSSDIKQIKHLLLVSSIYVTGRPVIFEENSISAVSSEPMSLGCDTESTNSFENNTRPEAVKIITL